MPWKRRRPRRLSSARLYAHGPIQPMGGPRRVTGAFPCANVPPFRTKAVLHGAAGTSQRVARPFLCAKEPPVRTILLLHGVAGNPNGVAGNENRMAGNSNGVGGN